MERKSKKEISPKEDKIERQKVKRNILITDIQKSKSLKKKKKEKKEKKENKEKKDKKQKDKKTP